MQQLGILNVSNESNQSISPNLNSEIRESENIIVLPNGEKIISLSGGKFGLLKNT